MQVLKQKGRNVYMQNTCLVYLICPTQSLRFQPHTEKKNIMHGKFKVTMCQPVGDLCTASTQ